METFKFPNNNKKIILALGAESAGNFSIFHKETIYFSEDFGDLLQDHNFNKFKSKLNKFLKQNEIKPNIILTDLHPLYKTAALGKKLAKKYKAKHIQVQHHIAHIFSAIGDKKIHNTLYIIPSTLYGIAMDGTGYGIDEKIWGGEVFQISNFIRHGGQISNKIQNFKSKKLNISRIGKLEDQIMIGGDLAVKEPLRMLIGILTKFIPKETIYKTIKNVSFVDGRQTMTHSNKIYTKREFEILYNQLRQNFNCVETSSAGRVLDAVSILLGFCGNKRNYKHEPIDLLEKNSTKPYTDLKTVIKSQITNHKQTTKHKTQNTKIFELNTTHLFEYLIKNIKKDKKCLAATAQLYIAQGLQEIINLHSVDIKCPSAVSLGHLMSKRDIFISGGISNNKIISSYLESKGAYKSKKIPAGDAGLSLGQTIYYLLTDPRN